MQIYAEAESNANSFALACFVRRRREALDSRIQRAEHVMQAVGLALPRREPYFRRSRISQKPRAEQTSLQLPRRNSISAAGKYTQKPRAEQTSLQLPRREPYFRRSRISQKPGAEQTCLQLPRREQCFCRRQIYAEAGSLIFGGKCH